MDKLFQSDDEGKSYYISDTWKDGTVGNLKHLKASNLYNESNIGDTYIVRTGGYKYLGNGKFEKIHHMKAIVKDAEVSVPFSNGYHFDFTLEGEPYKFAGNMYLDCRTPEYKPSLNINHLLCLSICIRCYINILMILVIMNLLFIK